MKVIIKNLLLGLVVGAILSPATVEAQFTVFDPAQYSLQIERQIEEANRWLERINQYTNEINKLAEQLSTMRGVLGQAEKLVLHNDTLTRTMAQIGQTVRDVFALKRAMETMVISRLNMIKSIKTRLMSGILDPEADLRDFEDYLRNSIGRQEQDKIATMNHAMFDATGPALSRFTSRRSKASQAAQQMKQAKESDAELAKAQNRAVRTASPISSWDCYCENDRGSRAQITSLSAQIEDRVSLQPDNERACRVANRVKSSEAWDNLNIVKDGIFAQFKEAACHLRRRTNSTNQCLTQAGLITKLGS